MLSEKNETNIPNDVMNEIKEYAKSEWPDDFTMQLDIITNQKEAYFHIDSLKKQLAGDETFNKILALATSEWPKDFVMQFDCIENQIDALNAINSLIENPEIPKNILENIVIQSIDE